MSQDIEAHEIYGEDPAGYAESNPHSEPRAEYEWPAVRALLPDVDGLDVLDAGCGPGYYTNWLAERGALPVGVDASEAMIEEAQGRYGDAARFEQADLTQGLPFADDHFDLVVCQLTLEHVEDWRPVMAEFARVLGPGGQLVVSTDHPFSTYYVIEDEPADIGSAQVQSADYFATERYHRDWGEDEEMLVPFYRRPLQAVLSPLFQAGFALTALREPSYGGDNEFVAYFDERVPRFLAFRARVTGLAP